MVILLHTVYRFPRLLMVIKFLKEKKEDGVKVVLDPWKLRGNFNFHKNKSGSQINR